MASDIKGATPPATLAIDGGTPAIVSPLPLMFPGGMRIGKLEEQLVLEVLHQKRLFRYQPTSDFGASKVRELEEKFAHHVNVKHSLAVNSGTSALMCALCALGVGPGDEVIVPAYTWIATPAAVAFMGAVPILAEIDESLLLDPTDLPNKLTTRTKAIIAVHMRGAPCNMDKIMQFADAHNIRVVEDVAQADGGSFNGKKLGSIGHVGAFSFQFNKTITAGEGGMVTTNSTEYYNKMLMFHDVNGGRRNHVADEQIIQGLNFRMTELQAAVLLAQLTKLDEILIDMRNARMLLKEKISEVVKQKGVTYRVGNDEKGDTAICLIIFAPDDKKAEAICSALLAEGVHGTLQLYNHKVPDSHVYCFWTFVMLKKGNAWKYPPSDVKYSTEMCPKTLKLCGRSVQIDISPDLTAENINQLAEAITKTLYHLL